MPLQKEIYRSRKISGVVRLLNGQETLPDDSTLVQNNISDGDTLSALIEPDKEISVQIKLLGSRPIIQAFSQSESEGNVKQAILQNLYHYDFTRLVPSYKKQ